MSAPIISIETMRDGAAVRAARYEPEAAPVGVVQMVHGFGEHIGHYAGLGEFFARNGFAFVLHEQRGFGEMPGLDGRRRKAARGVVPSYETFFEDVTALRDRIGAWYPGLPVILFGHSMGGNIALNYLINHPQERYSRAVIESPWLRLYKPFPPIFTAFARLLGGVSGGLAVSSGLNVDAVSRNRAGVDEIKNDALFHDRISFRLYAAVTDAGERALRDAARVTLPTLLLCAGGDKIVSPDAIRAFAKGAGGNVTFVEYPDGYHALHQDTISAEVLDGALAFCKAALA